MKNLLNYNKNKFSPFGFTLLELLAIIVILAVIALITTPIILNIIEESKEKTRRISVHNYADVVEMVHAEEALKNTKVIDYKSLANKRISNQTVQCEVVTYCKETGPVLSNCTVGGKGEYYFGNRIIVKTKPINMDDVIACKALIKDENGQPNEDFTGNEVQTDYQKPENNTDVGIIENVIDKQDELYTIYSLAYTTNVSSSAVEKMLYSVYVDVPFDTSKYTFEVISTELMTSLEDFSNHEELKSKGIITNGSSDGSDTVATIEQRQKHSITATELLSMDATPTCSGNKCKVKIGEIYNKLTNITPHQTVTKKGSAIKVIYIPAKIKMKIKKLPAQNSNNFDLDKYAFSKTLTNAFGDNAATFDKTINDPNLKKINSSVYMLPNEHALLPVTLDKPGYYVFQATCYNQQQAGFLPVCYNLESFITNSDNYVVIDDSYPEYITGGKEDEKIILRVTQKQVGQKVYLRSTSQKHRMINHGQSIHLNAYYLPANNIENTALEEGISKYQNTNNYLYQKVSYVKDYDLKNSWHVIEEKASTVKILSDRLVNKDTMEYCQNVNYLKSEKNPCANFAEADLPTIRSNYEKKIGTTTSLQIPDILKIPYNVLVSTEGEVSIEHLINKQLYYPWLYYNSFYCTTSAKSNLGFLNIEDISYGFRPIIEVAKADVQVME